MNRGQRTLKIPPSRVVPQLTSTFPASLKRHCSTVPALPVWKGKDRDIPAAVRYSVLRVVAFQGFFLLLLPPAHASPYRNRSQKVSWPHLSRTRDQTRRKRRRHVRPVRLRPRRQFPSRQAFY